MKFGLAISAIGHTLLFLWAVLSFSAQPLVAAAPDSLPVDIISDTQFSQLMKGSKDAPKAEMPKPLVDKVEEAKPAEQVAPPVAEKPEVKPIPTEAPPELRTTEQKPEPPKVEKKEPPKVDPIAEAIKKDEAKQRAEAKAKEKAKADAAKKKPKFNANEIAELINKQDPRRNAATGETPNQTPSLGAPTGSAAMLSQSEIDALRQRLMQLWNPPAGARNPQELIVKIRIKLGRDGKLAAPPMVLTSGSGAIFEAARDGAVRALFQGQPYEMLKPEHYDLWKEMEITFDPREMAG